MTLSTSFNPSDARFFYKNFDVVRTNVSCLDDAEIIAIGDAHPRQEDQLKKCWLLYKLARREDELYVESSTKHLNRHLYFKNMHELSPPNQITVMGWDSLEFRKFHIELLEECQEAITNNQAFIENLSHKTDAEIRQQINEIKTQKANLKKIGNDILSELNKIIKNNESIVNSIKRDIQIIIKDEQAITDIFRNENLLKGKNLKLKYLLELKHFNSMIGFVLFIEGNVSTFGRNCSLKNKIAQMRGHGKRAFIFGGKSHFCNCFNKDGENPSMEEIDRQGIIAFRNAVKDKKFAILFPNAHTTDIDQAKNFFKDYKVSKFVEKVVYPIYCKSIEWGIKNVAFKVFTAGAALGMLGIALSNSFSNVMNVTVSLSSLALLYFSKRLFSFEVESSYRTDDNVYADSVGYKEMNAFNVSLLSLFKKIDSEALMLSEHKKED